ncbi:MAG TPA: DUF4124 domain-containing protein [Burkholderiales bacterium]|nr:DUF4124 domain-containing protein [Burkholderiales bacterium]
MRKLILALLLAASAPPAWADIYECVDANGNKRFTNIKAEAKGCKVLNVSIPNTVPSPKAQGKNTATPPTFPKVEPELQRQRDSDRRKILEQELAGEEKLLDQARKELAEQEAVRLGSERNYQRVLERLEPYKKKVKLHEDNVASLRRELGNTK